MNVTIHHTVQHALEHASHLLPAQKPIEAFVHHNTLHAFEHLTFEQAVEEAGRTLGAEPYMKEAAFRDAWTQGRIFDVDLDDVLSRRVPDEAMRLGVPGLTARDAVRRWMLGMPLPRAGAALQWRLHETDELRVLPTGLSRDAYERLSAAGPADIVQAALWRAARRVHPTPDVTTTPTVRVRDRVLAATGTDIDTLVHPVLIRWCAAFLDPSYAYWPMMDRHEGFYTAMLRHLAQPGGSPRGWMRSLAAQARTLLDQQTPALTCITDTLDRLGTPAHQIHDAVTTTLLALPGWPGMFVQLADRPDVAPAPPPPTPLEDFLAIRLLVDEAAARHTTHTPVGPVAPTETSLLLPVTRDPAWDLFAAARCLGVLPQELATAGEGRDQLLRLLDSYDNLRRRALWQLAYERRYRMSILDGLIAHQRHITRRTTPTKAQVVCCIDDREESLRRHLEEVDPAYQTFGVAGFYGVAMYFKPLGVPRATPLCPAVIVPKHLIEEVPADDHVAAWDKHRSQRARLGRIRQALSVSSETLFRGGLVSLTGWSSIIPLLVRIFAPRLHARMTQPPPAVPTRLALDVDPDRHEHGLQVGFHHDEMVAIVRGMLENMGLTRDFAPLVFILGHGSRSMNNPHKAAYDCGACGGGQGGPNARAFAEMANRPAVRASLRNAGIDIPDTTWFIGGFHNTADDAIDTYDLDRVPEALRPSLATVLADLDEARSRDAHERCRRFESAPLDLDFQGALEHVENRVEDLAQPRPECGHCTNALCFVGRRAWSEGLFLDRRVFLTSYDPDIDPDGAILERILASVGPVGAGINLEYYFSFVDPDRYGASTKLPHNIASLLGVMDGGSSDLRTGLPWQMVEIHEPVRLLNVIEASPERLLAILERQPGLARLITNRWILVAAFDPSTGTVSFFGDNGFEPHVPETHDLPEVPSSTAWYGGRRDNVAPASVIRPPKNRDVLR